MKKKLTTLSLLAAGFAFAFASIAGTPVGTYADRDESIDWPALADIDDAQGFAYSSGSYGFKRIDDRRTAITSSAGWGGRCYFDYSFTSFESFEVQLDLSGLTSGVAAGIGFGQRNNYQSEAGCGLWADILKSSAGYYVVTLNRGDSDTHEGYMDHNLSLEQWTADNYLNQGGYIGRQVYPENDIITFGCETDGDEVRVYVEDQSVTFDYDFIFQYFDEEYYFMYAGGISGSSTNYTVVNYLGDAEALAYYDEETGAYYEAKNAVDEFVAAAADATFEDVDDFIAVYTQKDEVGICFNNLIYDFDEVYLRRTFDPALETLLANGLAQFGDSLYVSLLDYYVTYLEEVTDGGLETEDELFALMAQIDTVTEILEALDNATLTYEEETEAMALIERYRDINQDITTLADALYTDLVQNVIDLMNSAATVDEVYQAEVAYLTLSTTFDSYVSESVLANMTESLASAREAFLAKYSGDAVAEINGWRNGSTSQNRVIQEDDGIGLVAWTGISAGTQDGGGLLYTREALDVIDFTMSYEVTQLTTKYAISFMADATFFSSADDASVAEHTGLVFLVTALNATTATVQAYLINDSATSFYDGDDVFSGEFSIPKTGEITLTMKLVQIEEDGAINNYFTFDFNGNSYAAPSVKAMDLLNAFPNGTGYVGIGSQGNDDQATPVALKIKEVNGKSVVTSDSLKADASIYNPVFAQDSYTYLAESGNNLTIGVDPRLQTEASFALDGETMTATDDYLYTNNSTLTLRASFLNDVEVGEHTLTMTTAMGTGSTTIIVEAADTGEDEDDDPITGDEEPDTGTSEEDPEDEEPVTTDEPGSSEEPTTTEDTTTTDTEGEVETDTGTEDTADEGGLGTGAIIGIAIGAIVVLAVIAGLVVVIVRKKKA